MQHSLSTLLPRSLRLGACERIIESFRERWPSMGKMASAAIFLVYMLRKIDFVSFKSEHGAATCQKLLSKFAKVCEI